MSTFDSAVPALLSLAGVGIGATLQHLFSRSAETRKQAYSLRQQAYVDYLKALANAGHAVGPTDLAQAQLLAADAKTRIVVYGDREVLEALAEFEEAGAALDNPKSVERFLLLALRMRTKSDVTAARIGRILIGPSRRRPAVTSTSEPAPANLAADEERKR